MPQKPTMPSPYMTTVDANEPITFSCEISSKDTIVDYHFDYFEIQNDNAENNTNNNTKVEMFLPSIYVGRATFYARYFSDTADSTKGRQNPVGTVDIYKNDNDNMYTMVMERLTNENMELFVNRNSLTTVSYEANWVDMYKNLGVTPAQVSCIYYKYVQGMNAVIPPLTGFVNLTEFKFVGFEILDDSDETYSSHKKARFYSKNTRIVGMSPFKDCKNLKEIEFPHIPQQPCASAVAAIDRIKNSQSSNSAYFTLADIDSTRDDIYSVRWGFEKEIRSGQVNYYVKKYDNGWDDSSVEALETLLESIVQDYGYVHPEILYNSNFTKITIANPYVFYGSLGKTINGYTTSYLSTVLPKSTKEIVITKNVTPKMSKNTLVWRDSNFLPLTSSNRILTRITPSNVVYAHAFNDNFKYDSADKYSGNNTVEKIVFLSRNGLRFEDGAFAKFTNLKNIEGIDAITNIGDKVFLNCTSIGNILKLMPNVTTIGDYAFQNSNMSDIIITNKMQTISKNAFTGCHRLTVIELLPRDLNAEHTNELYPLFSDTAFTQYFDNCGCLNDSGEYDSSLFIKVFFEQKYQTYNNLVTALNSAKISTDISGNTEEIPIRYKLCTIYEKDGYSQVPIYGGSDNSTLSVKVNGGVLNNDSEYYWTLTLKDSLGREIISPQYYFKTRATPIIEIPDVSMEFTESRTVNDETMSIAFAPQNLIQSSVKVFKDDKAIYTEYNNGCIKQVYSDKLILIHRNDIKEVDSPTCYLVYTGGGMIKRVESFEIYNHFITAETLTMQIVTDTKTVTVPWSLDEENTTESKRVYITDNTYRGDLNNLPITEKIMVEVETEADQDGDGIKDTEMQEKDIVKEYPFIISMPFDEGTYNISYYRNKVAIPHTLVFQAKYKMPSIDNSFISIKRHRWRLYEIDDSTGLIKGMSVDDTGDIYSAYLRYSYDKFISGKKYELELEVENDEGVVVYDTYSFEIVNIENDLSVDFPTIMSDKSINAIAIDFTECEDEDVKYTVIRHNITDSSYTTITEEGYCGQKFYDFTTASHKKYEYIIYAFKDGEMTTHTTDTIIPDWCKTTVIGFNGSYASTEPFEVNPEDIWTFELNISKRDFTQNIRKEVRNAVGSRYPRITAGKTNYKSFELSGLFGHAKNGNYSGDDIDKIEKWERFVASPTAKLVVDTKGNVSVCDITDSKYGYEDNYIEQPTTISVSFTEIAPSDRVSLIMVE